MSDSESLPRREVTSDLVYFAAGECTGFSKGVPQRPWPGAGGQPAKKKGSGRCPEQILGLTSPKPRWQEVVEPPADPPQKGVALLKPTKGEAMLGSK